MAKIEVDKELVSKATASPLHELILNRGKSLGFKQVVIDIDGYQRGKLTNHLVNIEEM